jgi:geranylgeranyl diphosphate synthase type I
VFGDPALTGKPAGDDLREGKRTLLVALAMAAADADQRELLRAGLGDRSLDEARVAPLRDVIVASGALAEVEARILACAEQARAALRSPAIRPSARDALAALVAAATERHA